jgi:hypothetical protein
MGSDRAEAKGWDVEKKKRIICPSNKKYYGYEVKV